jgi:hypothetical protein
MCYYYKTLALQWFLALYLHLIITYGSCSTVHHLFLFFIIVSKLTIVNHLAEFVGNIYFYCLLLVWPLSEPATSGSGSFSFDPGSVSSCKFKKFVKEDGEQNKCTWVNSLFLVDLAPLVPDPDAMKLAESLQFFTLILISNFPKNLFCIYETSDTTLRFRILLRGGGGM